MTTISIPGEFRKTILETFGESGAAWLSGLPALIRACEEQWDLRVGDPMPLSYNYVAEAVSMDGVPLVLKLGVPNTELTSEIQALQYFDSRGAVRLLDADPDNGILLMERLIPGRPLEELPDDNQATEIAAGVMRRLWRSVPSEQNLLTQEQWTAGLARLRAEFDGGSGPFPEAMVARAEGLFAELIASTTSRVLLYGDLHYWNILSSERQDWLAIDPKGVVGDPAFEPSAWLLNSKPPELIGLELRRQLLRRVDQFADLLTLDRARLLGWGYARAVLSAWWSCEDHGYGWEHALAVAEGLRV
jgi:streptomycin 6-kinase